MPQPIRPKQLALALRVSESSVKRWCDQGVIRTQRTAGGHRRIPLADVVEFLRQGEHALADPELLGWPPGTGERRWSRSEATAGIRNALLAGNDEVLRRIIFELLLAGERLSSICDGVLAAAFADIGRLWHEGAVEIYQERRACQICLRLVHELRTTVANPGRSAPQALGGTIAGDHYALATAMVELVLRDCGWNAASLGNGLPWEALVAAVREQRPRIFWLSVSRIDDRAEFVARYAQLMATAGSRTALVVGGRGLDEPLRRRISYAAFCDNLQHLETFARTVWSGPSNPPESRWAAVEHGG